MVMQEDFNMPSPENGRHEIESSEEIDSLREPLRDWLANDAPHIVTKAHDELHDELCDELRPQLKKSGEKFDLDLEVTLPIFQAWSVVETIRDEMTPTSLEINDSSWLEVLGYRDEPNYRNALLDKFDAELLREKVLTGTGIDLQEEPSYYTEQAALIIYAMISEFYYQTYTAA